MNYKNVKIDKTAKIAKQSVIIGDVTIGRDSCVLYYSVIRGDDAPIAIGEETNIQENCVLHESDGQPIIIGEHTTLGHGCIIHACEIGDNSLIGMNAVVLNGAKIGNNCIVGAGCVVTEGMVVPDYHMVIGIPGKIKREVSQDEVVSIIESLSEGNLTEAQRMYAEGLVFHPNDDLLRKIGAL